MNNTNDSLTINAGASRTTMGKTASRTSQTLRACLLALGFSLTAATVSSAGNVPTSVFNYGFNYIYPYCYWQSIKATVDPTGHEDFFFYVEVVSSYPYFYRFWTCQTPGEPAVAEFDTIIEIIDPTGKVVAYNDDYCGYQSLVEFYPSFKGWYAVRVRGWGYSSGSTNLKYRLFCPTL
ncbi:MAG TPA: hypothetical protein VK639_09290 [Terriglobales bacterium]|nr:hypothetical protein [Terriglobales bacterium]